MNCPQNDKYITVSCGTETGFTISRMTKGRKARTWVLNPIC